MVRVGTVFLGFNRPRSRRVWPSATLLLGLALAITCVAPAMAATQAPEVGYLPASQVSASGATIEVPINPDGGETSYEIWLECQSARESNQSCEPLTVGPQRQQGVISPGFGSQIVTDAVAGLQADYLYKYRVVAVNSAGKAGNVGDGFLTCPSQGSCPSQPYLEGESLWNLEGAERVADEAPRLEAEREAKRKEAEEPPAKEAAERAAKEREAREAGERIGKEEAERAARTDSPTCVVPRLRGDSLTAARRALARAHCGVGRLTEPRSYRGPLVVVEQSAHSGSKLSAGSRVALTLSRRKR
jgi:hypothetical protein